MQTSPVEMQWFNSVSTYVCTVIYVSMISLSVSIPTIILSFSRDKEIGCIQYNKTNIYFYSSNLQYCYYHFNLPIIFLKLHFYEMSKKNWKIWIYQSPLQIAFVWPTVRHLKRFNLQWYKANSHISKLKTERLINYQNNF